MHVTSETENTTPKSRTNLTRKSERELVLTRTINGPVRLVYEAWAKAELFQQWWVPKSAGITLLSCEWDARTGGSYRLTFKAGDSSVAFFGRFLDVVPLQRIVWTNDESGDAGAISTATFEEKGEKTLLTIHELFPTAEALEAALSSGEKDGMDETFNQLEALLGLS